MREPLDRSKLDRAGLTTRRAVAEAFDAIRAGLVRHPRLDAVTLDRRVHAFAGEEEA